MLSLYYKIWMDLIVIKRAHNKRMKGWAGFTFFIMTFFQGINLFVVLILVKKFLPPNFPNYINVNFFHIDVLDSFCSGLFTFFLPFVILNYLLIFRNRRYGNLIKKYHNSGGKLFMGYMIVTAGIAILLVTGVFDYLGI